MQVKVGEKIRLIKAMGAFTNIGEECEVTEVKPDGEISFRFGGCHMEQCRLMKLINILRRL